MEWPSGKELWTKPNERGHDVQSLPNGHVLFTIGPKKSVVELNANHQPVWTYSEGLEHPLAAQRLPNGNTLIGDAKLGRVIEVTPDKKVVWKYENPDIANMRMRNSHRTDAGTTLIAVEAESRILEVDTAGKIVWEWQAPNGANRTLVSGATSSQRQHAGQPLRPRRDRRSRSERQDRAVDRGHENGYPVRLGFRIRRAPDGGMLISDYTGRRIVEVDAAGKVVHELRTGPRTVASIDLLP